LRGRQKEEEAAELGVEAVRCKIEQGYVRLRGSHGSDLCETFFVLAPWQARKTLFVENLADHHGGQGRGIMGQSLRDVVY